MDMSGLEARDPAARRSEQRRGVALGAAERAGAGQREAEARCACVYTHDCVFKASGRCLGGVWEVSVRCLEKVSEDAPLERMSQK